MLVASFEQHIEAQIDRLDESVDKVWESAGEIETVMRYLNVCPLAERNQLLDYARRRLDYLPQQESERVKRTLDEMIRLIQKKEINQKSVTTATKDKSNDHMEY